jgi:membrane glycosyltransferase
MALSITLRRYLLFSLIVLTTLGAIGLLTSVFLRDGITPLKLLLIVLYAVLFAWICGSFWTAAIGFLSCFFKRDRLAITTAAGDIATDTGRTAIIIPIYNEDTRRVFAGLRAMCQALVETGQHAQFDIYVLSDTRDPDIWIEEEMHWQALCHAMSGKLAIFYRNRQRNINHKSGNIGDFCQHWGSYYRYMIVADADSIISGLTLVEMVNLMERNPHVALIQVPPVPVNKESLFARILQFAGSVYGRIFTAGLGFWQLGESNYWGHNAIVRIAPFIKHCGLPRLSGNEPFGGEVLSHDFVEAALLRRAGWGVWLAYNLGGSYEEIPPTLIDYAKRDRRWCQGNLQHLRLSFARGWHPINRLHFLMGVMSYLASPLWLLFLVVTGIEAFIQSRAEPVYFFGDNIFPVWPVSYRVEMTTVLAVTLAILFLPKLLALLLVFSEPETRRSYGGAVKASLSVLLETLFSALLAPILMLFQSKFVFAILLRRAIGWPEQQREDHSTGFKEALFAHGGQTLLGMATGTVAYWYIPTFFWWFTPVLLGLVSSIPISMLSSHVSLGRKARRLGFFLTPEETRPPRVLTLLKNYLGHDAELTYGHGSGFHKAIAEPLVNALHLSLLPPPSESKRHRHYLESLFFKLLEEGEESLSAAEKRELLSDRETVRRLHTIAWGLSDVLGQEFQPGLARLKNASV